MANISDNDSSDDEQMADGSEVSDDEGLDLEASATESDEDEEAEDEDEEDEDDDDEEDEAEKTNDVEDEDEELNDDEDDKDEDAAGPAKSKVEIHREKVIAKYKERQGKQLYLRFPAKLPNDEDEFQKLVKSLSPLIVTGHKPRQKHARFCLVNFASQADRDIALKKIRKAATGDGAGKGIFVELPKTEDPEFVKGLAHRKVQSIENKKAKRRLHKAHKKVRYATAVVVPNLPKGASEADVQKLFPNAVDIQLKPGQGKSINCTVAAITLPTSRDALAAFKQRLSFGGTQLKMRFAVQPTKAKPSAEGEPKKKIDTKNKADAAGGSSSKETVQKGKAKLKPSGLKSKA